jgi:DNA-binding MarR family transcriptional regulator
MDDQACQFMRLFSATFSLLHRRGAAGEFSLTPEGRSLLLHLAWAGPLSVGELATHTDRAQSVISESLAALESHDLVARVRDPRDRRKTLVWLTDRARRWLSQEQEPLDRSRVDAALLAMDPDARRRLLDSYEDFISCAQRQRNESLSPSCDGVAAIGIEDKKGK